MISKRIIPCLDVKNGRVVKGVNFEGIQDVADPVEMAEFYNQSGADELVFYDITASVEGRKIFTDILTEAAKRVFIPLTVGGGISTLDDFRPRFKMRRGQGQRQQRRDQKSGAYYRGGTPLRRSVCGAFDGC